ncbi:response regulator, partial [bacterium]|nr:response regulator [bacterium]
IAATKKTCELNKLITDHLTSPELIYLKKQNPNVTLNTNLTKEVITIDCSPIHMNKSIMNLLVNAYDAVNSNGIISIKTTRKYLDEPVRNYDNIKKGYYAVLTVEDNGIGLSNEDIDRIFEPFYTKKFLGRSGTGLGLSIVWNSVEDHNGYIDISAGQFGTAFNLYLPTADNPDTNETPGTANANYSGNKEKILIVDDEFIQRDLLCSILSMLNYLPVAVSSGEEAVEYLKNNSAELIVLDMILGRGLNGKETYEKIIAIQPGQKAIIVSGYSKNSDVIETQSLGAGVFISKPYNIKTIGKAIQEAL